MCAKLWCARRALKRLVFEGAMINTIDIVLRTTNDFFQCFVIEALILADDIIFSVAELVRVHQALDEARVRDKMVELAWPSFVEMARECGVRNDADLKDITARLHQGLQIR